MKRSKFSEAQIAFILRQADEGTPVVEVCRKAGISDATFCNWKNGQPDLDPERLVFIDETWASTNMVRRHGRCARGERLRVGVPHGHWKTTTFVAGLRARIAAPFVLDAPINRIAFETYSARSPCPNLRPATSSSWTISLARRDQECAR